MDAVDVEALRGTTLTIEKLLRHWGTRVRTPVVVDRIRDDLAAAGLMTVPDIERGPVFSTRVRVVEALGPDVAEPRPAAEEPVPAPRVQARPDAVVVAAGTGDQDTGTGAVLVVETARPDPPAPAGALDDGDADGDDIVPDGDDPDGADAESPAAAGAGDQAGSGPAAGDQQQPASGKRRRRGGRGKRNRKQEPAPGADERLPSMSLRVGDLACANGGVVSVTPQQRLDEATYAMHSHGYSQIPVLAGPYDARGVITWRSVAVLLGSEKPHTIANAMEEPEILQASADLMAVLPRIAEKEYALVARGGQITGIVTSFDLAREYRQLASPYFMVGEIERRLRRALAAIDVGDVRVVKPDAHDISDLMFGDYLRLIRRSGMWAKLDWPTVDYRSFDRELDGVRKIRNKIMHFDPEPVTDPEFDLLTRFRRLMKNLVPE